MKPATLHRFIPAEGIFVVLEMLISQAEAYMKPGKRIVIARKLIEGAAFNMVKNLRYYNNREKDTAAQINRIESLLATVPGAGDVETLPPTTKPFNCTIEELKL